MPITMTPDTATDVLWTSRRELERMFGPTNVEVWADTENTANQELISNNIEAAVEDATDEAMALLDGSPSGDVVEPSRTLRRMTTRLAGGLLYEARGVKDTSDEEGRHKLKYSLDRAKLWFRAVRAGQIFLEGTNPPVAYPFVVPHDVRHGGINSRKLNAEENLYAAEREEVMGVPTYQWFWGDGFSFTAFSG